MSKGMDEIVVVPGTFLDTVADGNLVGIGGLEDVTYDADEGAVSGHERLVGGHHFGPAPFFVAAMADFLLLDNCRMGLVEQLPGARPCRRAPPPLGRPARNLRQRRRRRGRKPPDR
jgi:hypothetical protein